MSAQKFGRLGGLIVAGAGIVMGCSTDVGTPGGEAPMDVGATGGPEGNEDPIESSESALTNPTRVTGTGLVNRESLFIGTITAYLMHLGKRQPVYWGSGFLHGSLMYTSAHVVEGLFQKFNQFPGMIQVVVRFPNLTRAREVVSYEGLTAPRTNCFNQLSFKDDIGVLRLAADGASSVYAAISEQLGLVGQNVDSTVDYSEPFFSTGILPAASNVYGRMNRGQPTNEIWTQAVSVRKGSCSSGGPCYETAVPELMVNPGDSGGPIWFGGAFRGITAGWGPSTATYSWTQVFTGCGSLPPTNYETTSTFWTKFSANAPFLRLMNLSGWNPQWWVTEARLNASTRYKYYRWTVSNQLQSVTSCNGVTCSGHGTCRATSMNEASCACDTGYMPDASGTQCEAATTCAAFQCPARSGCFVTPGGPTCVCNWGYAASETGTCEPYSIPACNPNPPPAPKVSNSVGGASISVRFFNRCGGLDPVNLIWVDYGGKEVPYGTIEAGSYKSMGTFVGNLWRLRNARTGALLKEVVIDPAQLRILVP